MEKWPRFKDITQSTRVGSLVSSCVRALAAPKASGTSQYKTESPSVFGRATALQKTPLTINEKIPREVSTEQPFCAVRRENKSERLGGPWKGGPEP